MPRTLTYRLQRFRDRDGRTLFFATFLGSRQRGWKTFKPEDVPEFEGDAADFRIEKRKGQWIILSTISPHP
jgi:hypothetical protein